MAEKTINTVIVLRNDSTTAWADSDYKLLAGEVGVGYMTRTDGTEVPIVKIGDGNTVWADLPQAEGVFENDVTLTSAFGKYVPSAAGYVTVDNSKGMTTSEFILSALSEVKDPDVTAPSFSLEATSLGTKEIGTTISSVAWKGTYTNGSYSYGAVKGEGEDEVKYDAPASSNQTVSGYEVTCTPVDGLGIVVKSTNQAEDGSATFSTGYTVSKTASTKIASVTSKCSWGASDRTPVNNVGARCEDLQLAAGSSTKTVDYSVSGYREGFYAGTVTTAITDPATQVTSAMIRGLATKSKTNYGKGSKTLSVPVGAASIIIACPADKTGVTDILNTTVNAGMNDAFKLSDPTVISVGGADATADSVGSYAVDYNVWVYTPAEAYGSTASLTITLGA